jgi:hypothetical protein
VQGAVVACDKAWMGQGPALRYYGSLVGRWSGRFEMTVTSSSALRGAAFPVRILATMIRLFGGAAQMHTTLAPEGAGFRHTTRVTKWGVRVFVTEEVISLQGDGRGLRMKGEQRRRFGAAEGYEAHGEIDETATRATYHLRWAGAEMTQRTAIVEEGLELTQETAWSRGYVLLRRKP